MRKLLLLLWLVASFIVSAQGVKKSQHKQRPALISNDTVLNRIVKQKDSVVEDIKVKEAKEKIARDLNKLLEDQKRREASEKRANIIRIGLGLIVLTVLVIGLIRRKK